jgi:rubredoxin
LNDKLCDVVRDLGLETEVARIFKPAKLLWFSFWMESLLSRQAMEVLRPLLQLFAVRQFGKERFPHNLRDFSRFDRALIAAMEHDIPLLVEMTPPGHTDFGHITTFAHCPTCRAAAPVEKWKKIRPFQHVCTVCGHEYNPASTLASTPESPEVHERLVNLLGEELFREFTANHLLQLGASPEETASAIAEFLAPPDPGIEERNRRTREVAREKLHFMQTAIFADCSLLREGAAPENITSPSYLLNRAEAENVLGRCRRWGVTVLRIGHYIDEFDEPLVRCIDFGSPETTLAALGTEDHNALFFLILHISDEALANWKDGEESRPPTPSQS